jgi:uncharacterized membrane protein (DUF4010 family)
VSAAFPPLETAVKLLISLGIGLLVGFEREWAHKDLGVRSFAITSLLGMLSALIGPTFSLGALMGVIALLAVVNIGNIIQQRPLETTTSAALLVTFALGILVGQGHVFTPTACAIVMTLLLALKPQFSRFAGGLTQEEVRSAVLLGLIGFVIYPVLPNRFVDPWDLLNPREAWLTVILISAIGFANYVLLRLYGGKGLYYTAIFGGLINSTATVAELSGPVATLALETPNLLIVVNLLTIIAMFARNLLLLAIIDPQAGASAAIPMAVMMIATAGFIWWWRGGQVELPDLKLGSPVSLRKVSTFGTIFLLIQIAGSVSERLFGQFGPVMISGLGGLASSASSTAAVASLSAHGRVSALIAALSTVVASAASALVNLPILFRQNRDKSTIRRLIAITAVITGMGLAALFIIDVLHLKL